VDTPPEPTEEDRRIAPRVAALALARERLPEIFDDDQLPPLPETIQEQLLALGISATEAADVIDWWTERRRRAPCAALRHPIIDDDRIARRIAGLGLLRELAPDLFDIEHPVPLAIGVTEEIIELGLEAETARDIMQWWGRHPAYRAVVDRPGIIRRHLDGTVQVAEAAAPQPAARSQSPVRNVVVSKPRSM
jgi:hypothetical protein